MKNSGGCVDAFDEDYYFNCTLFTLQVGRVSLSVVCLASLQHTENFRHVVACGDCGQQRYHLFGYRELRMCWWVLLLVVGPKSLE